MSPSYLILPLLMDDEGNFLSVSPYVLIFFTPVNHKATACKFLHTPVTSKIYNLNVNRAAVLFGSLLFVFLLINFFLLFLIFWRKMKLLHQKENFSKPFY